MIGKNHALLLLGLAAIIVILASFALFSRDVVRAWIVVLLLVGIALVILGLWLLALSRRIHPSIRRFQRLTLAPASLKALADTGQPVPLNLGGSSYRLAVVPTPVFDEGFDLIEVTRDGERKTRITEVITYSGRVLGHDESSDVRLTITEHAVDGYVKVGKDWWFIEPLRKFRLDANFDEFVAYRTADVRFQLECGADGIRPGPRGPGASELSPRLGPAIGINLAIDGEYLEQAGWTPLSAYQHNQIVLNAVNGIYSRETGCEFMLRNLVVSPGTLTSTDPVTLLQQLEDTVRNTSLGDMRLVSRRQATRSEIVHLTTAKNLKGKIIGIANINGVYGLSQHQLIWVGGSGLFGGGPNLGYMNMMIMAHELGHNFNGVHEEADKFCVTEFIICLDRVRTIMWPTVYDDNVDEFSDGQRDPSHNNRQRIIDNIATGRNQDY